MGKLWTPPAKAGGELLRRVGLWLPRRNPDVPPPRRPNRAQLRAFVHAQRKTGSPWTKPPHAALKDRRRRINRCARAAGRRTRA